ncbi:hypothetical protein JD844_023296 [Phrynosoma platyrhinos]|uniref:Uncharacterized protein n=1 Tax=Phrynosoma platyrhinos TaxID=52577 RepID=A0ABQ7SWG9_PHRPL|nr:hypothetical protein JD844_023296 [Phrynosoma platyrhinos]
MEESPTMTTTTEGTFCLHREVITQVNAKGDIINMECRIEYRSDGVNLTEHAEVTVTESSEDDYQYEEVPADDDFSIQEGDEDLAKALHTMQEQAIDAQIMAQRSGQIAKHSLSETPEVVDDFLCNFLIRMGMNRTLDCFQTEW